MKPLTRREFLKSSTMAGLALATARLTQPQRPVLDPAPPSSSKKQFQPFADQVQQTMEANDIPGIAVGIIRANKLVYADGFGVANMDTGAPMTSRSVMSMASIAKSFTGAAIMQLIENGQIQGIDDLYMDHVPYFTMEDPRFQQISIRHLLSHTSGMPPLTDADFFAEFMTPDYDDGAAERLVRSFSTGVMLAQDPGGPAFLYSDVGYDILADLIHNVTGQLFEDYMQEHILEPLRMKDSTFLFAEIDPDDLVAAHIRDENGNVVVWDYFPYDRKHAPSSCLHTSVEDYSQWLLAHLNGGAWRGKRILQPENQARLWEILYYWNPSDELEGGYGWGWDVGRFWEHQLIGSYGGQPGVQTTGLLLPTEGLGVIVLGNCLGSYNWEQYPTAYVVADLAFWALNWLVEGGGKEAGADGAAMMPAMDSFQVHLPFVPMRSR